MRTHGEINGVCFRCEGLKMSHAALQYDLRKDGVKKSVYVNTMTELKSEIVEFLKEL